MSDGELHYDPVADGPPPSMDKGDVLFIGAFAAFAVWFFAVGNVTPGLLAAVFAFDIWINAKKERSAYLRGYLTAVKATGEQLDADMEVEND